MFRCASEKLFVSTRMPLNNSTFKLTKPPAPIFEKLVPAGGGSEVQTLNSRTRPPTSKWDLLTGSGGSLAMKAGAGFGVFRVEVWTFNCVPARPDKAGAVGKVMVDPPAEPPTYCSGLSKATAKATLFVGRRTSRNSGMCPQTKPA